MSTSESARLDPTIDILHVVEVATGLIDSLIGGPGGEASSCMNPPRLHARQEFPPDLSMAIGAACIHKVLTDAGVADTALPSPTQLLELIKRLLQESPRIFWTGLSGAEDLHGRVWNARQSFDWSRFESANIAIASDDGEAILEALANFLWSNRHTALEPKPVLVPAEQPARSLLSYFNPPPKKRGKA